MRVFALLALAATSALAQPVHEDQWISTRAYVVAGPTGRVLAERLPEAKEAFLNVDGFGVPAFTTFIGSGTFFTRKWFGVLVDVRSDLVSARQAEAAAAGPEVKVSQPTVRSGAAAVFRWQATSSFGLEGHVGLAGSMRSFITPEAPRARLAKWTGGPLFGVAFDIDPTERFGLQVASRLELTVGGATGFSWVNSLSGRLGLKQIGSVDLGLALSLDTSFGVHRVLHATDFDAGEFVWRLGIGPSFVIRQPAPAKGVDAASAPSVVGTVSRDDGTPLQGAQVSSQGLTATTDAQGAFTLEGLAPGPASVRAEATALRAANKDVVVTPGTPVHVTFVLVAPTGPGSIKGVVRAGPGKPLTGAKVAVGGSTLTTDANGEWTVEKVGPGPVKVKVTLDGYAPADEVVQVPPEAAASLELTLEPVAQRTKAKIRGVISSAAGPVAKATVRIVELKLKQAVKADGRFEAEVPGGKYTLVIEAPKHVTQTRAVEVLDGDQAIFQIELEKAR